MNAFYYNQRLSARILAAVALFSLVASLIPMQVFATPNEDSKVNICKANQSGSGFVAGVKNVSTNAVNTGIGNSGINGDIVENGQNWNFVYPNAFTGQQIFNSNCAELVDQCPNIAGGQATVPNNLVKDQSGNCVTPTGTLTVTKTVAGAGATASPNNFNLMVGSVAVLSSVQTTFTPGTYTVTETNLPNYTPGPWGGDCSISGTVTLVAGVNKTCTITNTYVPPAPTTGTIVVDKVTVPAQDLQSFSFNTAGTGYAVFSLTDIATPNSQATLAAGTYSVAETSVAGWTQTSATCVSSTNGTEAPGAISLQAGEVVTCTFTNTKNAPGKGTIIVDKVTNPAADTQSFNFTTTGTGYTVFALTDAAIVNTQQLDAGTYSVAETAVAGWKQTSAVCVSSINGTETPAAISLQAGETVTCTYTNTKDIVPPATCTVVVTSDTADYVIEKSANAQVLSSIHVAWTATFGPASWIWGDNPVVDPTTSETQTFRKQFGFIGTVTSATLEVASDNNHTAILNTGTANAGGSTFNAPVSYPVTADVAQGNNTLVIGVTNTAVTGSTPTNNPAGLKYRLTIQGKPTTDADCSVPFVVDVCPNIPDVQAQVPNGQVIVNNQCVPIVNGCTNPLATNYNQSATPANPQATACTLNYVSQCGENPNLLTNGTFEAPTPTANPSGAGFWEIFPSITGWTATNGIEIWDNMLNAVGGNQVVELGTTVSSAISQTSVTVPGATYELRFDFAARSDSSSLAENSVRASVDGSSLITASTSNPNWTTYGTTFTADAATDITLADVGTSNGFGTVIDNAALCLVRLPDGGGDGDDALSCSITASENSIRRGRDVTINWSSVDAAYVTIPNLGDELGTSGSQLVENLGEDTTYTMTVFGDVIGNTDTREQATCSVTVDTRSGGGGGGGTRLDRTPDGDVLGASDDKKPTGEVLGAQTDTIPTGAPNTGKGGSSTEVFGQFLATTRRRNHA